ncbi:hypothetical protein F5B19DRAFT_449593 [Rostrohypoxylon terebratum]|nr:hypothetical protein F5B19DRAFT_449593 [Rostrohypoxylon terebratum]
MSQTTSLLLVILSDSVYFHNLDMLFGPISKPCTHIKPNGRHLPGSYIDDTRLSATSLLSKVVRRFLEPGNHDLTLLRFGGKGRHNG